MSRASTAPSGRATQTWVRSPSYTMAATGTLGLGSPLPVMIV